MTPNKDLINRAKAMVDWALTVDELKRLIRDLINALEKYEIEDYDIKGNEPDEANG